MTQFKMLAPVIVSCFLSSCYAVKQTTTGQRVPDSVFSHLMPIVDSTAFNIMRQDTFLTKTFSFAENGTMGTVYSLYLWGKNHFLHLSTNKGYFENQLGTAYLIFQSKQPGVGDTLKQLWQRHTKDSLIAYDFKGPDFILTEVIAARHDAIRKTSSNHLIPMLSSYSAETYKSWGLPPGRESGMSDFITAVDKKVTGVLFDRIQSVDLAVTKTELDLLTSMLLLNGYKRHSQGFSKSGEPSVNFIVNEKAGKSKVQRIKVLLSAATPARIISLGSSGQITFGGREAVFDFKKNL
jgi:hypothetical protein